LIGIRDLAQHLSISIGTVSRALNGKADVNADTRQRVLDAAAALGYSPNQSGRSLRHGKTHLIGVLIPTSREKTLLDFGFAEVLDGIRRVVAGQKHDLAVFLYSEDDDPFAYLRRIAERRIADGLVIANTLRNDPRIDYVINHSIPFVAFGRSRSGGDHQWVDIDFPGAVKQSVDRLVGLGHRRIGLVLMQRELNFLGLVRDAFRRALKSHGLPFDSELIQRHSHGEDSGYLGAEHLLALSDRPTAMLTQNGNVAVGLYRRLNEAGLRPGTDVSVVSLIGDVQSQFLSPALTSFNTDLWQIGTALGQALMAEVRQGSSAPLPPPVQLLMPMLISPGESDLRAPRPNAVGKSPERMAARSRDSWN
jgi:DNA-binding LacI/PurR family transcriptional regulator